MPSQQRLPAPSGADSFLKALRDPGRSLKNKYKDRPLELAESLGLILPKKPAQVMKEVGLWDEEKDGVIEPGLRDLIEDVCTLKVKSAVAVGPRGGGKALSVSTPIPTPYGWSTMGELKKGDIVFDERGRECTVTRAHPVLLGNRCFEVVFGDGSSIIADEGHLWKTETMLERSANAEHRRHKSSDGYGLDWRANQWKGWRSGVRTTLQILQTLTHGPRGDVNHTINNAKALRTSKKRLPLDPYLLGLWLGDGTTSSGNISVSRHDCKELVKRLEGRGHKALVYPDSSGNNRVRVVGLTTQLSRLNVLNNKHVPVEYLRGSKSQRRELLAGLMDSDGTIRNYNNNCQFDSTLKWLADSVYEIVVSLGWKATRGEKRATLNGKDCGLSYRVSFRPTSQIFYLERKANLLNLDVSQISRHLSRKIVDIVPVPSVPVRCIEVNSPSRLFLAGESMVPTHNSYGVAFIEFFLWLVHDFDALNLGGSELQADQVYQYLLQFIDSDEYWKSLIRGEPMKEKTFSTEDAWVRVLTASSRSVRSPHAGGMRKGKLRGGILVIDEEAETDEDIVNSALPTINTARPSVNVRACFHGDTLITLSDGTPRKIKDIKIGDKLLNLYPQYSNTNFQKVVQVHKRKMVSSDICKISPSGLPETIVTPEHMLFSGGGELPVEQACDEWLVSPRRLLSRSTNGFDVGWLAGFFLAEGSFRYLDKSGRSNEIIFSVHKNEAQTISDILVKAAHKWAPQMTGVKGSRLPRIIYDPRGDSASVRFSCKPIRRRLEKLIVDGSRLNWRPGGLGKISQKWLRKMPTQKDFAEGVLRGWLAGDGSNYSIEDSLDRSKPIIGYGSGKRASVDVSSGCLNLIWQMRQIALDVKCKASLSTCVQHKTSLGAGNVYWKLSINQFPDNRWWVWQGNQGKRDKHIDIRNGLLCRTECNPKNFSGFVYDLTVEDGHVYIANGILAHNSTFHKIGGSFQKVVDKHAQMGYKLYRHDIFDVSQKCDCVDKCQSEEKCFREDHIEEYVDPDDGLVKKRVLHKAYCGGRSRFGSGWIPPEEIVTLWRRMDRNHSRWEVEAMGSRPSSSGYVVKDQTKFSANITSKKPAEIYRPGSPVTICVDWGTVAAGLEVWQEQPFNKHAMIECVQLEENNQTQVFGVILGWRAKYKNDFKEVAADIGGGGNYLNKSLHEEYRLRVRDVNFQEDKEAAVAALNILSEGGRLIIPAEFEQYIEQIQGWMRKNGRIQKGDDHLCDASVCYFAQFIDRMGLQRIKVPGKSFSSNPAGRELTREEELKKSKYHKPQLRRAMIRTFGGK